MASITSNYFLDDAAATGTRTSGESWAMEGATLTIRTDTRWYPGAPASMTGSLGGIGFSATLGGKLFVDGTKVRWLQYNSGSGNVPAINTNVTQGGVSGVLLGVWADLTSAPTAVGAAMPSTGWIKFREVTGGTFSSGALTGVGASATGPDVVGWIEVVLRNGGGIQLSSLGEGLVTQGSWFNLGTTSGSRGQIVQVPTNGGGANTTLHAVQIETAPGSGVYEWWPATTSATTFTTTHIGTEKQAKVVQSIGNGQIRIGSNGTNDIGFLPPSGCNIRVPNIFVRLCTAGADATNNSSGSGSNTMSNPGRVSISNVLGDFFSGVPSGQISFEMIDSAPAFQISLSSVQESVNIDGCIFGGILAGTAPLALTDCRENITIANTLLAAGALNTSGHMNFTNCTNATVSQLKVINTRFRTNTNGWSVSLVGCRQFDMSDIWVNGATVRLLNSSKISIRDLDFTDRLVGSVNATQAIIAVRIEGCSDVLIDGFTYGERGTIPNQNNAGVVFSCASNTGDIRVRNAGTATAPLAVSATNPPTTVVNSQTGFREFFQRIYIGATSNSTVQITNTISRTLLESIYGNTTTSTNLERRMIVKSCQLNFGAFSLVRTNAVGSIFADIFTSATTGELVFVANRPGIIGDGKITLNVTPNAGTGYSATGSFFLKTAGDEFIQETDLIKGYTSFQNVMPDRQGVGMTTVLEQHYQIDTGSGWSAWKVLNGTNLSGETISPAGFKLKLRIRASTSNPNQEFSSVRIYMNTTAAAQQANLYPLDTVPVTLTNLVPGSEVRAYVGEDPATAVEIAGVESSGTSFSFNHSVAGQVGYIRVFALDYQPVVYNPYTYSINPAELLVQQVFDRNYANPA